MQKIKLIIFDFAGVISTKKCFVSIAEQLGKKARVNDKEILSALRFEQTPFQLGKETAKQFWKKRLVRFNIPFKDFAFSSAHWYKINPNVLSLAKKLKKNYAIAILSDNFENCSDAIRKDSRFGFFEKMFFSNEINVMKTSSRSFKLVLKEFKVKPKEAVFIDDHDGNLIMAKRIGMNTILFKDVKQLKKELKKLFILF